MNTEDFEKQLQQRPMRSVPMEWRREILAASKEAAAAPVKSRTGWTSVVKWLPSLSGMRPRALVGLSAAWIVIFAFRVSTHEESYSAGGMAPVSQEIMAQAREQRLFYAELVGLQQPPEADRPKRGVPRPRSEGRERSITT